MSTVNGLSSSSYTYSPTLNNYINESNLLQSSGTGSNINDLTSIGSELNQINQGINPQDAVKYESQSSTDILANSPTYSSSLLNYNSESSLILGINGTSTADSIIPLSSELNLLNEGIDTNQIPAVSSIAAQSSSTTDVAALGEELNLLNSGVNLDYLTSNQTPVLNYSYDPSAGITTNTTTDNSTGTNLDVTL